MQPRITKALIHVRWKLNRIIDGDGNMPAGIYPQVWDDLVAMRGTKASQSKVSAHVPNFAGEGVQHCTDEGH